MESSLHVVILSPHRDDAAFSCGLLLCALKASGADLSIVNVCTVSDYAPYLDADEQERVKQVTSARKQEDELFAFTLAAESGSQRGGMEFVDLGWLDAPLRWGIEHERVLAEHSLLGEEFAALTKQFQSLPKPDVVLAPLALGGHLDHRLVHESALWAFSPLQLMFYEDLPYACRMPASKNGVLDGDFDETVHLLPQVTVRGTKCRFALCYPTQVAPEVADELESYAATLDGKERYYGEAATAARLLERITGK